MKTFLNVLYRRILYKIPLKLLLVLLAVFGLLFACTNATSVSLTVNWWVDNFVYKSSYWNPEILCISNSNKCNNVVYTIGIDWNYSNNTQTPINTINNWDNLAYICTIEWQWFDVVPIWTSSPCVITVYYPDNYTIQQCQTEYNLIPISSVDQNYCTSNNLCPSWWTPWDCPNVWVSNIWINDIFHPWAFNVIMNIPEEIDRDYAYTNSWQNMNIDVVWYNVDYDYIDWVVDSQNYKPSSSDLSSIVSQIIPLFVPWLCIILLLYFIFRFIKKIF